tara:strand:+ start:42219 stop:42671 length:453 start_codon:yes stop_codon:yes gene_type:complete
MITPMNSIHIIKLVVGVDDIKHFYDIQRAHEFDYHGVPATPCWTRYKPKRAEEILRDGGSIYRVVKNRIVCRHKILGFEMVDTAEKGTMCMIVQDAQMIETVSMPRRAFQGWRYLKPSDVPADKGIYTGEDVQDNIPEDMSDALKEAGLL